MKLGYKLSHAVLGRNVCLEVRKSDAEKIADYLEKMEIFSSSEEMATLLDRVEEGDLSALERAAKIWEFENKLREQNEKRWS